MDKVNFMIVLGEGGGWLKFIDWGLGLGKGESVVISIILRF